MTYYLTAIFFMALNFGCNKTNTGPHQPGTGFEIYIVSDKNIKTSLYDFDSTWQNFLQNTPLPETRITEEEIESYDWDKQRILLNEKGKQRFLSYLDDKVFEPKFIVTLDGKRIYAGLVVIRFTQMALRYPILSYDDNGSNSKERFEKNPVLLLQPYLLQPKSEEQAESKTVKKTEIKDHFNKLGKLK